ncbi:MAG: hypothetical protein QXO57_02520 [Candidatus Aenigmatarchaeota archaeon]
MSVGILVDMFIIKILQTSNKPLSIQAIRNKAMKELNSYVSWEAIKNHVVKLRKTNKIEEILSGKRKLYILKK